MHINSLWPSDDKHMALVNWAINDPGIGLMPVQHQAIIQPKADI